MTDTKIAIVVDRFGDRWVNFKRHPGMFRNVDQDDDNKTLPGLQESVGPITDYRTGDVIEIPGVNDVR